MIDTENFSGFYLLAGKTSPLMKTFIFNKGGQKMYTIFMDLGYMTIRMESVSTLAEAVWRCGLYFDRNPHRYFIQNVTEGKRYTMFGTLEKELNVDHRKAQD